MGDEFNRNKETELSKNERITKTNGRSMNYRSTDNGIISTLVTLTFLSVMRDWVSAMSRSLLGGREHQITHANVYIELNGV